MPTENSFSPTELELINSVKKTLKILAKVIKDKEPGEVIKDIEPKDIIGEGPIAQIIKKANFLLRIKDFDPKSETANDDMAILLDELTTTIQEEDSSLVINDEELRESIEKLAQAIRERITPDLPGLNPKDESAILGHLGGRFLTSLLQN